MFLPKTKLNPFSLPVFAPTFSPFSPLCPPSLSPSSPCSLSRWDSWFTASPEASACVRTQQCSSQHRQHAEHAMLQQQHGVAHDSSPQDAHSPAAAQDGPNCSRWPVCLPFFKRYDSENINYFNPQCCPVCREKCCPAVIAVPPLRHKLAASPHVW